MRVYQFYALTHVQKELLIQLKHLKIACEAQVMGLLIG